jgi:prepilin-type N-terminal cleavage/methylation domain-containing protein
MRIHSTSLKTVGKGKRAEGGFTLLELMIVAAILAALAGAALWSVSDRQETALAQIARHEMQQLKQALLQFRQDTGYFPRQGPFALEPGTGCSGVSGATGGVRQTSLPSSYGSQSWFESSANFWQLYEQPVLCSEHPLGHLAQWNIDTARGWRGPYISRSGEGYVDVGNGANLVTGTALLTNIPGVADPFDATPITTALGRVFLWHIQLNDEGYARHGRPYLIFDLDDTGPDDSKEARIVSLGPDGQYAGRNAIDPCAPNDPDDPADPTDSYDLVLCLLK